MRPTEKKIENLLQKLNDQTSPDLDRRTLDDCFLEMDVQRTSPVSIGQHLWRIIMKNPITKFSIAAMLFIAVILGVNLIPGLNTQAQAFANIMDNVYNANSVRYEWTISKENWSHGYTCMINDLCVKRTDVHDGDTLMHDFKTGSHFQLYNGTKHAVLTRRIGDNQAKHPFHYLDWISKMHKKNAEFVGTEELDGKTLNLYSEKLEFEETKIWVDPQTDLPYRIVIESFPNDTVPVKPPSLVTYEKDFGGTGGYTYSVSAGNKWTGVQERQTQVFSDFEWNVQLDDSLFAFEAPEGYTFEEKKVVPQNNKDRQWLVESLSFWTEMSDGRFPDDISDLIDQEKVRALLIKKYNKNGDPKSEMEQAIEQMKVMVEASMFVQECIVHNVWTYNGQGVVYGDLETPVCWWQTGEDTYTVLYGDLTLLKDQPCPISK